VKADLEILLANVLDLWALIDPDRIIVKSKLHILTHLLEDVRQFGPAILYSTEIFECWNSIFRSCSVLSNRQAPSRDIAETLADMEAFLQSSPALQRRLGWVDPVFLQPGMSPLPS